MTLLAIDPGSGKCGVAVVSDDGHVLYRAVVNVAEIGAAVTRLIVEHAVTRLVLGDRTAAKIVRERLREACVPLSPVVVDEHLSSREGRQRYFDENPPRGWRRLLPIALQTPPRPYDDYVAVVLAERYLRTLATG